MKTLITAILALTTTAIFAQGPLTPPGAPAPTMKTLDEIHSKVADAGEKRTPISSIPFSITQPGSYYLTGNLSTALAVDGISIDAKNVTIDLNGFRMTGNGAGLKAIYITNANVTTETLVVKNGTLTGWQTAIGGESSSINAGSIEGVHVRDGYGIQLKDAKNVRVTGCVLENCLVDWNGVDAFVGTLMPGRNSVVSDCRVFSTAASQTPWAIAAFENSLVSDCTVTLSGNSGILSLNGSVCNCAVSGSSPNAFAITAQSVEGCTVRGAFRYGVNGNRVRGCSIIQMGGVAQPNGCFGITGSLNSRVSDCTVSGPPISVGVSLNASSMVEGTMVTGFGTGIKVAEASTVRGCEVCNAGVGIELGLRGTATENVIVGETILSTPARIGIAATAGENTLEGNRITACATGINLTTMGNTIIRNTLRGNTTALNIVGGNDVGAATTAAAATSPAGNIVN